MNLTAVLSFLYQMSLLSINAEIALIILKSLDILNKLNGIFEIDAEFWIYPLLSHKQCMFLSVMKVPQERDTMHVELESWGTAFCSLRVCPLPSVCYMWVSGHPHNPRGCRRFFSAYIHVHIYAERKNQHVSSHILKQCPRWPMKEKFILSHWH